MKKTLLILASTVLAALLTVGCAKEQEQDISSLKEKVEDLDSRVSKLEEAVAELNEKTVPGLQKLITALQGKVYVNSVTPTADGYVIAFSDGSSATLSNGQDGDDAITPVVGISKVEGSYVWTINGEVAKDAQGNPYPVVGISPEFKIESGEWFVSYDGENWAAVPVSGENVPAFALEETDESVIINFADGSSIILPKDNPFYLSFALPPEGLEILMGEQSYVFGKVIGANPGDNIEVGILSVAPGFKAEVLSAEDDPSTICILIKNISANSDETFKILVFASNGKGKTDIRGLVFSSTTLIAALTGSVVPVEGGSIGAFISSNVPYKIEIEDQAKSWVSIEQVSGTKAMFDDYISFKVEPNESNAYRSAYISIKNADTDEELRSLLIVQDPVSTVATDLESAYYMPHGTVVSVYGITVVAASGESSIITDGSFKMNMIGAKVEAGKVYDITGSIGETEYGLNQLIAESVSANTSIPAATVDPKENFSWYSWGDYNYFTANSGIVVAADKGFVISCSPYSDFQRVFVPVEPEESLNLESFVGKNVVFSGWAINNIPLEDNSTVVNILLESISEFSISEATDWNLYYSPTGSPYEDQGYPEVIGNETADTGYYYFSIFNADSIDEEFGSRENILAWAGDYLGNFSQYDISQRMLDYGSSFDAAYDYTAKSGSYETYYSELDYGRYYIIAASIDENACFNGKLALKEFEKKDPHKKAAYEEFLGEWTFFDENGIPQIWNFAEKVPGASYTVENISGLTPEGGQLAVAEYNAAAGNVTFSNQALGQWTYEGVTYQDYFVAVYNSYFGGFYDNSEYMDDPLIATLAFYEDGTADLRPSSDEYGPLEGFAYVFYDEDYEEYNYNTAVWFAGSTIRKGAFEEEAYDAEYSDYLGNWVDGAKVYTIAELESGKTYSVSGLSGQEAGYSVVAYFEKGRLILPEQVVSGTAANGVVLQGVSSDYTFNPINESTPATIFRAEAGDGVLTVKAGNSGQMLFSMYCFISFTNGTISGNSAISNIPASLKWLEPGQELDMLQLPYSDSDFISGLTMDQLTGTNWDGYALMQDYETGDWLTEREYFGPLTVKDTEDANGEDLLEISGLSYIFGELYGVDDAVVFDLYNGLIYSHTVERQITDGDLAGSTLKVDYLTSDGDSYDNVNYCLVGGWVADGIVALAPYSEYIANYDITFDGISFPIYDGAGEFMGSLFSLRSILLVDSAVYPTPEFAAAAIKKALQKKSSVKPERKSVKAGRTVKAQKLHRQMNIFKAKAGGKRAKAAANVQNKQVSGKKAPVQRSAARIRNAR